MAARYALTPLSDRGPTDGVVRHGGPPAPALTVPGVEVEPGGMDGISVCRDAAAECRTESQGKGKQAKFAALVDGISLELLPSHSSAHHRSASATIGHQRAFSSFAASTSSAPVLVKSCPPGCSCSSPEIKNNWCSFDVSPLLYLETGGTVSTPPIPPPPSSPPPPPPLCHYGRDN